MDYQKYIDLILNFTKQNIANVLFTILILSIGLWFVKKIVNLTKKIMAKRGVNSTLQNFSGNLLSWGLKILVFITAISQLGIETTSFIAVLGAAGLAIGLALQGALSNFAGGALIMVFKPFKIGDLIKAQGELGVVKEIQIFATKLTSPENKLILIPNGVLANGNITNYTAEGKLRVDITFGVGYNEDIKKTKEVLMHVLVNTKNVLKNPAPTVNVSELADSSVNFAVRPWATPENYWKVYANVLEEGKNALDKAGIEIPYPHRVILKK